MKHEILNQILKPQIVWKKYLFLTFSPELLVENKTRKGRTYNIYFISFIKFDWPGQRGPIQSQMESLSNFIFDFETLSFFQWLLSLLIIFNLYLFALLICNKGTV